MEKCCKCGKEAVLNEKCLCFDCAELGTIKLTKIQRVRFPKSVALILFLIFSAVNIGLTYYLLIKCHAKVEIVLIGYVVIAVVLICLELVHYKPQYKYPRWEKPIVHLIAKYTVSFILGFQNDRVLFKGRALQSLKVSVCFVVIWVVVEILLIFMFTKQAQIYRENWIFRQMKSRFSDMPKVTQESPLLRNGGMQVECNEQVYYAVDVVRCSDWEDEIKEKVIELIESREDELWTNNKIKLYYCRAVENCMDAVFRTYENGDWVNEIMYDIKNGFKIVTESDIENASKLVMEEDFTASYYGVRELFELFQTARSNLLEPWNRYAEWEKQIGISQRFQEFRNESIGVTLGEKGEQQVARELRPYEGQIIALPNLRLEVEGESIENDFILISPYGIYVLEVKNLGSGGGYGLYIEKDGRWNKMRGRSLEYMESPVHQNERHILYLEKYVNTELGRNLDNYLRVQGMVVIANDKVDIKNESDNLVLRYNNIMGTIRKQPVIMKEKEMKKIAEILLKAALEPKEYPMANYFNYYLEAKIFTDDYLFWKERTEGLKKYVDEYRQKNVNSKGISYI